MKNRCAAAMHLALSNLSSYRKTTISDEVMANPLENTQHSLEDNEMAAMAKALAHPARLRILRLLARAPGCIGGDIVDAVGLAQSTVSEHLRILKAAGVITGQIDPPRVCYALAPGAMAPLASLISELDAVCAATGCCVPDPSRQG